jgi:hypothetical protein
MSQKFDMRPVDSFTHTEAELMQQKYYHFDGRDPVIVLIYQTFLAPTGLYLS